MKPIDPVCGENVTERILADSHGYLVSAFLGKIERQNGMISEYFGLARFVAAVGIAGIAIAVSSFEVNDWASRD